MGSLGALIYTVGADISGFTEAAGSVLTNLDSLADKSAIAGAAFEGTILKSLANAPDVLSETASSFKEATSLLDPFASAATQVGEAISSMLPPAFQFSEAAQGIIDKQAGLNAAAADSVAAFQEIKTAYEQGAASADDVARAEATMHSAIAAVTPGLHESAEASSGLAAGLNEIGAAVGVALTLDKVVDVLKDVVSESIDAYSKIELATSSLTALTGSAESAEAIISKMKNLGMSTIFAFPDLVQAAQKMAALGVAASSIPDAMQAVTSAAQVTGNGLDSVSSALDRIYLSATISPRTLTQLGISMQDLADTMGMSANDVTEAFKALGPQSDDALQLLTATILRRTGPAADAMKGDLQVAINALKTSWENALETFGKEDFGPALKELLSDLQAAIPYVEQVGVTLAQWNFSAVRDAVDVVKLLGSVVGDALSPLQSMGVTFKDVASGILNSIIPINAFKAGLLDEVAVIDVLRGKYPDLVTALKSLNAELDGQADAAKASSVSVSAAFSMLGSSAADATQPLTGAAKASNDLSSAFASIEGPAAAAADKTAAAKKAAQDALQAHRELAAEETLRAAATKDITEAENALAASTRSSYIPVAMDMEDAEAALNNARANRASAAAAVTAAEQALLAATAPGQHNTQAIADADLQLTLARQALKDQDAALSEREKDLAVSKKVVTDATTLLSAADKESASALTSIAGPAMLSYVDALAAVSLAKQKVVADQAVLTDAEQTYWDLVHSTGVKDLGEIADAAAFVADAYKQQATDAAAAKTAETNLNTIQNDGTKIAKALLDGNSALQTAYTKFAPTIKDLGTQLQGIQVDQIALNQAESDEYDALANIQAAKDAGLTQGAYVDQQLAAEKIARDNVAKSSAALSVAIQQLAKDYGISYAAAKLLVDEQTTGLDSVQALGDAYTDFGIKTPQSLQLILKSAQDAYQAISDAGDTSLQTQTKALGALVQAYQDAGQTVPDSLQNALGQATIKTQDYINDSVKLWTQFSIDVDNEMKGMFSGLITDVFTGGDFVKTMEDTLQKVGETIVTAIFKPFTDLISSTISSLVTPLAETLAGWIKDALSAIFPSLASAVGGVTTAAAVTANTTAITANTAAMAALTAALGTAAGTSAATAGVDAAGGVASASGSAGSSAASGIGSALSSVSGIVTAVSSSISAVTGLLNMFGVGNSGDQLDRLNGIDNATTYLAWVFSAGGLHDAALNTQNTLNNLFEAFTTWYKDVVTGMWGDLDGINNRFQIFAEGTFPDFAKALLAGGLTIATVAGAAPVAAQTTADTTPTTQTAPAPSTTPPAEPSAPETPTSPTIVQATGDQQALADLASQETATNALLSTLRDSLLRDQAKLASDTSSQQSASDLVNSLQDQINTATDALKNATDPEQQQALANQIAVLQGKLVQAQSTLADTQKSVRDDLAAQSSITQQIVATQQKLADIVAKMDQASQPVPTLTMPGFTDFGRPQIDHGILTSSLGSAISAYSRATLAALRTPVTIPRAPSISPPPQPTSSPSPSALKGNVYLDGRELFTSFVQWAEDNGLVIPQS